jgi:hypothetical protein
MPPDVPQQHPAGEHLVFRADRQAYLVAALLTGFFLGVGALAVRESTGAWPVLAAAGVAALYLVGGVAALRLEIDGGGVRYRTLTARWDLPFEDIERAYVEHVANRAAPHGVGLFWIKPRHAAPLRVDLPKLGGEATRALTAALARRGIPVAVPERPGARPRRVL